MGSIKSTLQVPPHQDSLLQYPRHPNRDYLIYDVHLDFWMVYMSLWFCISFGFYTPFGFYAPVDLDDPRQQVLEGSDDIVPLKV